MIRQKKAGFTVVETLIVLAVSGVLFISVAALISGQLNRFRTRDAVFNLESSVRDVLNDVATGYYPEIGQKVTCNDIIGGEDRGQSTQCVLAGKQIEFTTNEMKITPVVASKSLSNTPTTTSQLTPLYKLTETKAYQWGIYPKNVPPDPAPVFYVINKNYNTDNGTNVSGGQSVGIYGVSGTNLVPITGSAGKVCFVNGGQDSSITLGKAGGLTIDATIKDTGC